MCAPVIPGLNDDQLVRVLERASGRGDERGLGAAAAARRGQGSVRGAVRARCRSRPTRSCIASARRAAARSSTTRGSTCAAAAKACTRRRIGEAVRHDREAARLERARRRARLRHGSRGRRRRPRNYPCFDRDLRSSVAIRQLVRELRRFPCDHTKVVGSILQMRTLVVLACSSPPAPVRRSRDPRSMISTPGRAIATRASRTAQDIATDDGSPGS